LRHSLAQPILDRLVYSFADSYSKTIIDAHQAEARDYFLGKLDERQTYFAKAGDLFAGRGPLSVVRMFAELTLRFVAYAAGCASVMWSVKRWDSFWFVDDPGTKRWNVILVCDVPGNGSVRQYASAIKNG
jgi:hypothetical protein